MVSTSDTGDFYVCPHHIEMHGYEDCCDCDGWEEGDPEYGRLCTEAGRELRELRGRDAVRWESLEVPPADDGQSKQRSAAALTALNLEVHDISESS